MGRGTFILTPGPGTYRVPSEFGQYQAQDKYIGEYERIDMKRSARISVPRNGRNGGSRTATRTMASTMGGRSNSQPALLAAGGKVAEAKTEKGAKDAKDANGVGSVKKA